MAYPKEISFDEIRTINFSDLQLFYVLVGTVFSRPVRIIRISNLTNVNVLMSLDGITDHDYIPSNTVTVYDLTENKNRDEGLYIREGAGIYVLAPLGQIPKSGRLYVTVLAGK